ncbi:hypothetical protein SMICM304S_05970 [Streptomyces microflavus]
MLIAGKGSSATDAAAGDGCCRSATWPPCAKNGDSLFAEYSSRLAEAHAGAGGRTFLSRFDRRRGGPGRRVRAWHCADIPFAFGNLHDESVHFLTGGPPGPADHELSHRMAGAWAAFAAHGEPGWAPLGGGAGGAVGGGGAEGAAVRVWRTAGEEARATDGCPPHGAVCSSMAQTVRHHAT